MNVVSQLTKMYFLAYFVLAHSSPNSWDFPNLRVLDVCFVMKTEVTFGRI